MARDYYSVLGVKKDADQKQIKTAFRKLARKHHPDVNPGDKAAEERFKEINAAHDVLSDPKKRAKYDRYGENWEQAEAFEKARAQQGAGGPGGHTESFSFDINDLLRRQGGRTQTGGGFDFGDVLGGIFGGGRRQAGPSRGHNVEYETEITLQKGDTRQAGHLPLQSQIPCPSACREGRCVG